MIRYGTGNFFFGNRHPFWFLNEESLKWEIQMKAKAQTTHHAKCQLDKKKELSKPPIWGCCGLTGGSFLTYRPIKHSAFFEGR